MSNYKKLEVWNDALDWACETIKILESLDTNRKHYRLFEQIEASATSVAMNIAEGCGRYSKKEFVQYLYIARGSLFETITLLEIFNKLDWLENEHKTNLCNKAELISKKLNALIKSIKSSISKN
ncbi:MAG: four helix bundle protein [bacterium]|nr:four helix bundle protein [bacterium]